MGWPNVYTFCGPVAEPHDWFAWKPVKTWDGRWVWLRKVRRVLVQAHEYLPGPSRPFWSYAIPEAP